MGSEPSSCRRIRFSFFPPPNRKGNAIENSPSPPPPLLPVYGRNGFLFVRSDETFSCEEKKKKRKEKKKANRRTRFVTKGCKVRARRYSPRCELWFTVLATPEWKAFRRKPTAGLYSVYYKRPIEIDIPGKVGPQQNQRNNGSAGVCVCVCTLAGHENNG